jgi:flavin-dependent thymidylate synthase
VKVDLIDYTGRGFDDPWYAACLMIWTKQTRTQMSPGGFHQIMTWPKSKLVEELNYMAATVPSSWEFCNFTFLISGVTRAFTHQLVRTRTASYAQQAMQVLNMSEGPGWDYLTGPTLHGRSDDAQAVYMEAMTNTAKAYKDLVNRPGIKTEDARGLLPTNILTNIVMSANLRSLCDLIRKRVSPRNQGEFVDVLREMKREMIAALPWVTIFLEREADVVAKELYALIEQLPAGKHRTDIIKRVDQLLTNVGAGEAG